MTLYKFSENACLGAECAFGALSTCNVLTFFRVSSILCQGCHGLYRLTRTMNKVSAITMQPVY
jgi:hypothetical protein